jgi:hypothetical protein
VTESEHSAYLYGYDVGRNSMLAEWEAVAHWPYSLNEVTADYVKALRCHKYAIKRTAQDD